MSFRKGKRSFYGRADSLHHLWHVREFKTSTLPREFRLTFLSRFQYALVYFTHPFLTFVLANLCCERVYSRSFSFRLRAPASLLPRRTRSICIFEEEHGNTTARTGFRRLRK